jgi:hypothetical protein
MIIKMHIKENDEIMFVTVDEYYEVAESLQYLGLEHIDYFVNEKMYRIIWYDYIDDEWRDIWCTEDKYKENLDLVIESEVEYKVVEYN